MLPLSAERIKALFGEALRLHRAGRLDAAEATYREVLAAHPGAAEAHYQLGRIALERGAADQAVRHFEAARGLKPGEPAIWTAEAEALARIGDARRSRAFLRAATAAGLKGAHLRAVEDRLAPALARRRPVLGSAPPGEVKALVALMKAERYPEAERRARALVTAHPDSAVVRLALANALAAQDRIAPALAAFEATLAIDPDYAEARSDLGLVLIAAGRVEEGVAQLRRSLKLSPDNPLALLNLGRGLADMGDPHKAIAAFRRALELEPRLTSARPRLAEQLVKVGMPDDAERILSTPAAQRENPARRLLALAKVRAAQNRPDAARESFAAAIAADPDRAAAYRDRATFLQSLGEFAAAEADFRKAIALEPTHGAQYRMLLASYRITPDDPLLARMERLFHGTELPDDRSRMELGFALARAMEQIGAHDRVFSYLGPANRLMRRLYPFDIASRRAEIDGLKAAFADTDFARRRVAEATGAGPIFVTGMPRSGTTLVEQIIASHSRVDGAGEVGFFAQKASLLLADGGGYRPLSQIDDAELRNLGQGTADMHRHLCPEAEIVTDKSIQTYLVMGMVRLAMPNARIVVVRRDPRDNCLSIYKNVFAEGTHRYAYDLRDLGLYYRTFVEMLDFWRAKLPGGFHEIRYEELIADPEGQARALIAACGLDWEEACLDFHKTERRVSTISLHQVRQPIYASSSGAWQRHAHELGELIEALGDAVG